MSFTTCCRYEINSEKFIQLLELQVNLKPMPATENCGKVPSKCSMFPVCTRSCVLHFPIFVISCVAVKMLTGLVSDNG